MSYLVLARKWRPRRFDDMVGQGHVLQALTNALDRDRLHHAYLFTGTRGVGKTTVARIFAKALNCEQGVSSQPCGKCGACREIDSGRFVDLIEVDAASRTKVDDTRDLLENVVYLPVKGRFKIYLIDEVHMFSQASFNALLKTLEEPPEHVKFLLATTDPQKLPVTVLSRCLQFNLRALPQAHIQTYLADILEREGLDADPEALKLVSDAAGGSMRDALSLVDQAIGFCDGRLGAEAVADMLGVTDRRLLHGLLAALAKGEAQQLFGLVDQALERSVDPARLLAELAEAVHQAALTQWLPQDGPRLEADPTTLQLWYQIALAGRRDIGWAPSPRVGLEMTLLRMLAFQPGHQPTGQQPTDQGESGASRASGADEAPRVTDRAPASYSIRSPESGASVEQPRNFQDFQDAHDAHEARGGEPFEVPRQIPPEISPEARVDASRTNGSSPSPEAAQQAASVGAGSGPNDGLAITPENWAEVVGRLSMPARSFAERCHATIDEDSVVLVIDPGFRSMASKATQERLTVQLQRLGVRQPVRFMIGDTAGTTVKSEPISTGSVGDPVGARDVGGAGVSAPLQTPADARERDERVDAETRETSLREHPAAGVLRERAGGELIRESVRPVDGHGTVNEQ